MPGRPSSLIAASSLLGITELMGDFVGGWWQSLPGRGIPTLDTGVVTIGGTDADGILLTGVPGKTGPVTAILLYSIGP